MKSIYILLFLSPLFLFSQEKKQLDHDAYNIWRVVDKQAISNDGTLVTYATETNGVGNKEVKLHKINGEELLSYHRGSNPIFSNNSEFLVFKISPDIFEERDLKRKKTKEKERHF